MTTNMNFGPEWMRGKLAQHDGSRNGTDFASRSFLDSLMPFEDSNHLQFQQQQQQQHQQENPFKYSKEFMLGLFKPALQLPSDFKQHEYVTTDACNAPLAFEELTEAEKKLLSGPVHSEVSSRKNQRHRGGNDLYGNNSPMQSPASENGPATPGGSRLGQRKGRNDYFAKDQPIKRGGGDSSDLLRRRDHSEDMNLSLGNSSGKADEGGKEQHQPSWAISEGSSGLGGTFGSGGLGGGSSSSSDASAAFKSDALFGGSNGLSGSVAPPPDLSGLSLSPSARKPEDIKWFYRDPSGQVQGPFAAQEMQDWYKAGFFVPTLMLRRDDETVFEPLMVLTQKVGNEDQPFLTPRPSASLRAPAPPAGLNNSSAGVDMFGSQGANNNLFRSGPDLQHKYMPFGSSSAASAAPTTPGGSIMDSFLGGGGNSSSGMYQSPYSSNFGSSLLRDNRWNAADSQPQASPSWLNPSTPELFGNSALSSPFMNHHHQQQQQQQQSTLNPMFGSGGGGSNMNSPGLFDYQRSVMDPMDQHQQYNLMLQQKQQQQSMQFQQQFHQMQFQQQDQQQQQQFASPAQQQHEALQQPVQQQQQQQQAPQAPQVPQGQSPPSAQQNAFKNTPLENLSSINTGLIGSNHASPVMRSSILTGGWGSAPGTPLGNDAPSSPWGSIVSNAIPNKVSEELQSKAPGAQSPRAPSSPTKKPIEKPAAKTKTHIESFADIQLAEQKKAAEAKAMADAKHAAEAKAAAAAAAAERAAAAEKAASAAATTANVSPKATTPVTTPAAVAKPVVSLREIQEEELRIANLKKAKAKQAAITTPSWAASNNTPLSSLTTGTWSQPAHKPLSLREIQEMEAKQAAESKKASAASYLAHQEQLANATPSTLSWGVVVPNSKSSSANTPSSSASSSANNNNNNNSNNAAAAWTAPTGPKKTLREIQQEEELAMKKKTAKATKTAAAIAAANASNSNASSPSKAYAATPSAGGAWTTVTNTRAAKPSPAPAPAAVAPPPPQPTQWTPVKPATRATTTARTSGPSEDFRRWCRKALRDLNSGVNQEEIVSMLLSFPADSGSAEIIEDVIYANSVRIDGKRFAQEFMKRRKADIAGRLDIVTAGLEDEDDDDFKVVVTKKGKKKQSS
ncbi:hypothetical protein MBANPS3_001456 [Mucor bainieri]